MSRTSNNEKFLIISANCYQNITLNLNMKNVIVFMEPPEKANEISIKAGNLYVNRFCIDEDAAFELSGVYYFEKWDELEGIDDFLYKRKSLIDSALRKAVESNSFELHVIIAGDGYPFDIANSIRKLIKRPTSKSVLVTTIYMYRDLLISKDNMEHICKGKAYRKDDHRYQDDYTIEYGRYVGDTSRYEESVNDDLELYFNDLQLGREPTSWNWTYFLPELTQDELKLVEEKNKDYFETFVWSMNPDVDEDEMKSSTSTSKYVSGYCRRKTFRIPTFQDMNEPGIDETDAENSDINDSDIDDRKNCCACQ